MRTKDPRGRKPNIERVTAMKELRDRGWTWERIGRRFKVTRAAASQAVKRHFPT
jgi:transcriptional regulator